jgi:hypothetical protein
VGIEPNEKKPNRDVFLFPDTEELRELVVYRYPKGE